ncbi:MAG: hypothetical protein JW864_02125 [Spirochaetes bacterium]|nr:hypothetical protein [Spirochaetota bacterium]
MNKDNSKLISINRIDKTDSFALIPGYQNKKKVRKLKEIRKSKNNCYFAGNISHSLIDFIYRAVLKLNLKDKKLIFSRGAVKINNRSVFHATAIRELDWDAGISIKIPHRLKYSNKIKIQYNNKEEHLGLMEVIVLSALLHIAFPSKPSKWCTESAVLIIAGGWKEFENKK